LLIQTALGTTIKKQILDLMPKEISPKIIKVSFKEISLELDMED